MLHASAGMQPKIFWVATKHGLSRDLVVFSPWIKVSDPEEIQSCQGCLEHNHLIRCQGRPLSAYLEWDTPGSLPKNFGLGQRPKYPGKTCSSSLDLILSHSTSARRGRPRLASAQVARPQVRSGWPRSTSGVFRLARPPGQSSPRFSRLSWPQGRGDVTPAPRRPRPRDRGI